MIRPLIIGFGLAGLLTLNTMADAQVFVKAPFVRVWTGGPDGPVFVKAPLVTVDVPGANPGTSLVPVYTPPVVVTPLPPPTPPPVVVTPVPVVPSPTPVVVVPKAVLNHYEFARAFVPTPGPHTVKLIHPGSGAVVEVSFTLPAGAPKVEAFPRAVVFYYGATEVEIFFGLKGKVKVINR